MDSAVAGRGREVGLTFGWSCTVKNGTGSILDGARAARVSCAHAANGATGTGRHGVPRSQPGRGPNAAIRHRPGLRRIRAGPVRDAAAAANAPPGLLPHAQSLAPRAAASGGWRSGGVHAAAQHHARAALAGASARRGDRAHLSGAVQVVPRADGWAFPRRVPIRRAQPVEGGSVCRFRPGGAEEWSGLRAARQRLRPQQFLLEAAFGVVPEAGSLVAQAAGGAAAAGDFGGDLLLRGGVGDGDH